MGLERYYQKRNFRDTPEPRGAVSKRDQHRFVVQEHHASRLHFDFRLEIDGVLKSWAVPKGPSLDPSEKRLAVQVEDHPVDYINFEGRIAEGNYGAGDVRVWDIGKFEVSRGEDPAEMLEEGRLRFTLHGKRLNGEFNLVQMPRRDKQWLLIKGDDEFADPDWTLPLILEEMTLKETKTTGRSKRPSGAVRGDSSAAKARNTKKKAREAAPRGERVNAKAAARGKAPWAEAPGATVAEMPAASHPMLATLVDTPFGDAVSAQAFFDGETLAGDAAVKIGKNIVSLTHLDKVYWPDDGFTKGDMLRYYYEAAKYLLPYTTGRPAILKRYPNGIGASSFFQHDVDNAPAYVQTIKLEAESGREIDYVLVSNVETLLYTANLGTVAQNPWNSRIDLLDYPDWIVFDLDPKKAPFRIVREVALAVKETLDRLGLKSYPKTSGSTGIHVYVPIKPVYSYEDVINFAARVASAVVHEFPKIATMERSLSARGKNKVYVDHLQNARGKSVAAPYSVRAKPGATVSAPLEWREVERDIAIEDFTIENMPARLRKKGDLFRDVLRKRQSLEKAMEQLGMGREKKSR